MKNVQNSNLMALGRLCARALTCVSIAGLSVATAAPQRLFVQGEDQEAAQVSNVPVQVAVMPPTANGRTVVPSVQTVLPSRAPTRAAVRASDDTTLTPNEVREQVRLLWQDLKDLVANTDQEFGGGKLLKEDAELVEDDAAAIQAAMNDISTHLKNAVLGKQLLRNTLKGFLREATLACPSLPCQTANFDRESLENLLNIAKDYQKESQGYYDRIYRSLFMVAGSAATNMDLCQSRECVRTIWGLYHALAAKSVEAFGQQALELKNVAKWSPFVFVNWRRNHPSYFFTETLDETVNSIWPANEFVTPGNGMVMTVRTAIASAYTSVEGWFTDIYNTLKNARLTRFEFKLRPIHHDIVFTEIENLARAKNEILPTKQLLMRQDLEEDPGDGGDGATQAAPLARR